MGAENVRDPGVRVQYGVNWGTSIHGQLPQTLPFPGESSLFLFIIFQANINSGLILLVLVPASPTRIQFSPKKLHVNKDEVPFLSSLVFIPSTPTPRLFPPSPSWHLGENQEIAVGSVLVKDFVNIKRIQFSGFVTQQSDEASQKSYLDLLGPSYYKHLAHSKCVWWPGLSQGKVNLLS